MKHRLSSLAIRLWLMRRAGRIRFDAWNYTSAFLEWLQDARHTIRQGPCDYARRGRSNREGSNNRRFRAFSASRVSQSSISIIWPDYAL